MSTISGHKINYGFAFLPLANVSTYVPWVPLTGEVVNLIKFRGDAVPNLFCHKLIFSSRWMDGWMEFYERKERNKKHKQHQPQPQRCTALWLRHFVFSKSNLLWNACEIQLCGLGIFGKHFKLEATFFFTLVIDSLPDKVERAKAVIVGLTRVSVRFSLVKGTTTTTF